VSPLFKPHIWSHMAFLPTTSAIKIPITTKTFHRSVILANDAPTIHILVGVFLHDAFNWSINGFECRCYRETK
jgi:hypothetical protein